MANQGKNQTQGGSSAQEQDINQLLKIKREKLAALQEAGKDPFKITKFDVTAHSRDIKENYGQMEGQDKHNKYSLSAPASIRTGNGR